eukprot:TRINITY_DN2442_c0_g1_i2.p1 TRINITY_DN2442_c0_g1~~TRINITY_DN2442_c0_g1_i2.p1  ORF type:complete len:294 (-),score=52.32 TRINITY_DN2442_c0_g1_i2:104-985(-)
MAPSTNYNPIVESRCSSCHWSTFSFWARDECKQCNHTLNDATLTLHEPPVSISKPKSIVVKIAGGASFQHYHPNAILHVGITNSQGNVFHYDERGVHVDDFWNECLSIQIFQTPSTPTEATTTTTAQEPSTENTLTPSDDVWDKYLLTYCEIKRGDPSNRYHPLQNNCYSYVVGVFNHIQVGGSAVVHDKVSLVHQYLETPIQLLEGYLRIHGEIKSRGFFSSPTPSISEAEKITDANRSFTCDSCGLIMDKSEEVKHFRCSVCSDFDLCEFCYISQPEENGTHKKQHLMSEM